MSPDWDNFFTATAQVAVTAFSIMFLSMQVKSTVWRGRRLLGVAAVAALVELFVPLLASLITLMVGHPWRVAGALAGGLGLLVVVGHWVIYILERRTETPTKFDRTQLYGSVLSLLIYGLVTLSAFDPWGWGLSMLAAMCVWLLLSGSFEAWWLLEPKGMQGGRQSNRLSDRVEDPRGQ
jgi:hypothetical protein